MFKKIIIGVCSFLAIILLFSSVVVTNENEYKLIRRFGKVETIITEPGLSFKIPLISSADTLPKEILLYDLAASDVITMDKKTMLMDSFVLWKITDPLKFAQSLNSSVSQAESRIDTVVYNSLKNIISSTTQNDIISNRGLVLSESVLEGIGTNLSQYGIQLVTIETKKLDLPADNKTAVYERMISERAKIAATYTAEGSSEAQVIRNTTDKEIAINVSTAQKDAETIIAQGEGEYMRIISDAYRDESRSEFYSFVRSLDAVETSLGEGNSTIILPADSPIAKIFMTN